MEILRSPEAYPASKFTTQTKLDSVKLIELLARDCGFRGPMSWTQGYALLKRLKGIGSTHPLLPPWECGFDKERFELAKCHAAEILAMKLQRDRGRFLLKMFFMLAMGPVATLAFVLLLWLSYNVISGPACFFAGFVLGLVWWAAVKATIRAYCELFEGEEKWLRRDLEAFGVSVGGHEVQPERN